VKASGVFLRGMAMGAADIVPGVSGGTVAFITGIYPRLLHSIRSIDLTALRLLLGGEVPAAWRHVNGGFLTLLAAGILTSILSLARVLGWLLEHYPEPLWALFFGLILSSAILLLQQVPRWEWRTSAALTFGVAAAVAVALAPRSGFIEGEAGIFLAGFIAICAMILPGISGSFILVLLGMYSRVLDAVREFDLVLLGLFALGAGCGLLCFSRLLDWLLQRYRGTTVALLTGFLFGSLAVVWPWKRTLSWVEGSDGTPRPAQQIPVLPQDYLADTGADPMLLLCAGLALAGFLGVLLIDRRWGQLQVDAK
jgi:putative membrane protein